MALTGIHFILTYSCTRECDHCFLFGSPKARGKFTIEQILEVLNEAQKIGTVEIVYFEGGEPFLSYKTMLKGIEHARELGFQIGIVTNGYWAKDTETARRLLKPLSEMGLADLSISDDDFHSDGITAPAKIATQVAREMGLPVGNIKIDNPLPGRVGSIPEKGKPIIGGDVRFRGRAVEMLTDETPRHNWKVFDKCSHEELKNPERVHIDPFGNVFLCQGISLGNMWKTPLSEIISKYQINSHPIFRFIEEGGPACLAKRYGIDGEQEFVDECHLCYVVRRELLNDFPEILAPRQMYGIYDQ
ncbi:MAG: radical SAM protein [Candidatus Kariarchaeaceae archaeon]|jgi:MoaA/NifB/PqqE/SkfB family radical SAM enzyme